MKKGKKAITLRLSEQERKGIQQDAEKEGRSMASLLLWLWRRWHERRE